MSKIIQFWFAAVLFIVSGVSAKDVTEEDIKKGSVKCIPRSDKGIHF